MVTLPASSDSLLIRTAAGCAAEWEALCAAVRTENADGFRAYVAFVDDRAWYGTSAEVLRNAVPGGEERASVLFAADERTLTETGHPVLVIDLIEHRPPFRCVAEELWAVDNNLNISNVDWEEFADATDETGVYRGF